MEIDKIKTMKYLKSMDKWGKSMSDEFDDFQSLLTMKYGNANEICDVNINSKLARIQDKCCDIQDLMLEIEQILNDNDKGDK